MARQSERDSTDPRRFTLRELSAVTSYAESIIGRKVSSAGVSVATDGTITSAAAREALSLHDTEFRDLERLSRMDRGQRAAWVDGALEARPPATDLALPDTAQPEPVDPPDPPAAASPRLTTRQRRENRLALRRDWMGKRINRADADFERSRAAVEGIEPGQPILVGHHSERKHRRAIERSHDAMRRAMDSNEMATRHGFAASALERELERSIYHDDPDAAQQLESRIAEREITRDRIKSANQGLRKLVKTNPEPSNDQLLALGFIADEIATIRSRQANLNRPTLDVYPFLNLVTADIARNKKRLAEIRKSKTLGVVASPKPAREELLEHVGAVSNEMARTQEMERRGLLLRLQAGETVTDKDLKAIGYRPWQIGRLREQDWSEWKPDWAPDNHADAGKNAGLPEARQLGEYEATIRDADQRKQSISRELDRLILAGGPSAEVANRLTARVSQHEDDQERVRNANQKLKALWEEKESPSDEQLAGLGYTNVEVAKLRLQQLAGAGYFNRLSAGRLDTFPSGEIQGSINKDRIRLDAALAASQHQSPETDQLLAERAKAYAAVIKKPSKANTQAFKNAARAYVEAMGSAGVSDEASFALENQPLAALENLREIRIAQAEQQRRERWAYSNSYDPAFNVSDALTSEPVVTGYAPLDAPAVGAVEGVAPNVTASVTGEVLELSQAVVDGSQHARRRALTLQQAATEVKSAAEEVRLHTANATALADEAKALMAEADTLEPVAETGGGAPGSANDGSGGEGKPHESEPPATDGEGPDEPQTPQFQVEIANASLKAVSAVEAAEAAQDIAAAALVESQKATIALERLNFAWAQLQEMSAAANAKAQAIDTDPESISVAETYAADARQALASVEPDVQLANQLVAEARTDALNVVAQADVIAADNRAAASAIGQAAEQGRTFDLVKVYHGTHAEFEQLEPQLMVGASRPMTFTSDSFPLASGYGVGGRVIEGYILDDGAIPIVRMPTNYAGNAPIIRYPARNYDDASVFVLHTPEVFHQGAEHRWDPELAKWGLAPRPAHSTSRVLTKPKRTRGYMARVVPKSARKASAAPHPWLRTNELR